MSVDREASKQADRLAELLALSYEPMLVWRLTAGVEPAHRDEQAVTLTGGS